MGDRKSDCKKERGGRWGVAWPLTCITPKYPTYLQTKKKTTKKQQAHLKVQKGRYSVPRS